MKREPVLVILNGVAVVVSLTLVALASVGALDWDGEQIAKVVAAIAGVANLVAVAIRSTVSPA